MAKRKRKNLVTIIFLLLILAALIVAYVLLGKKGNDEEDDTKSSLSPIAKIDLDKTKTFILRNADADITLIKKDDVWVSEVDPDRPIRQSYIKTMLNLIDEITPERIINENPEDLAEYGLAEPAIFIQAIQDDGAKVTVQVGDKGLDGYYALVNEDGIVYMLGYSYYTSFDYSDTELTEVQNGPSITSTDIKRLVIVNKDGQELEMVNDSKHELNYSGIFSWFMLKPFEEGYAVDSESLSEFLTNYSSFTYNYCVDYKGENPEKYGLTEPVATVYVEYVKTRTEKLEEPEVDEETGETIEERTYEEQLSYKLYIGNQNEDGDYYVKSDDSDAIYTMKASYVDPMLTYDIYSLLSKFINIPNIANVDNVEITIDGNTHTMSITRETKTNEEGKEETVETYYHNGRIVEEKLFKNVYQKLIGAKYDTMLNKEVSVAGKKPYLTISYHLIKEDKTYTTNYYPYDEIFYMVENNGVIRFLADKRAIDAIAKAVIEFKEDK